MTMHSFLLIGQSIMAGRGVIGSVPVIENPRLFVARNARWQPMFFPVNPDRPFSGLSLAEFLVYSLVQEIWIVVMIVILFKAIATTTYVMITLKVVRNLVEDEMSTTGMSLVNTASSLGMIIMQNVGGVVVEATSLRSFYLILAAIMALIILLTTFLKVSNTKKVFE